MKNATKRKKQEPPPRWKALKFLADGAMKCSLEGAAINDLLVVELGRETLEKCNLLMGTPTTETEPTKTSVDSSGSAPSNP